MQIALLENEIRHNRSHIKGYSNAYAHIWLEFDSLGGATDDDARKKYPEDENEQSRDANNRWNEIFDEVENILAEKNG